MCRENPQAGPKFAAILSVVESCRRLQLPVRDYLAAVLPGLADLPIQRLADLTPAVWLAHSWNQATPLQLKRQTPSPLLCEVKWLVVRHGEADKK